ncbi:hypothetical protein IFY90_004266 [Salmonella enterica]|nr:hypothetical protein [Salmonella enterica]
MKFNVIALVVAFTFAATPALANDLFVFKCTSNGSDSASNGAGKTVVLVEDSPIPNSKEWNRVATWQDKRGYHMETPLYLSDTSPNEQGKLETIYFFAKQEDSGDMKNGALLLIYNKSENSVSYKISHPKDEHKDANGQLTNVFDEGKCIQTDVSRGQ